MPSSAIFIGIFLAASSISTVVGQNCGGVLESNAGAIMYKLGERYTNMERCVWTIVAQNRSKIELELVQDGLYAGLSSPRDMISIYGVNSKHEVVEMKELFAGDRERHVFDTALIYVSFTTYLYNFGNGTGFLISYQATGPEVVSALNYQVFHIIEQFGFFPHRPSDPNPQFISYTFNPVNHTFDNRLSLNVKNFYTGNDGGYNFCNYPLNVYECNQGFIFKRLGLCGYHPPIVLESPSPLIDGLSASYDITQNQK